MQAFPGIRDLGGDLVLAVASAPATPRLGGGRFLIIICLLLAILAGAGVFLLGNFGGGGGAIGGGPNETVVVAAQSITIRHQLTDSDLTTTKISGTLQNTDTKAVDGKGRISEMPPTKGDLVPS